MQKMKMNKTTVLWAVVVLLAVLNVTTIGTILYQNMTLQQDESILVEPDAPPINGRYFRQNIGFDAHQMQVYRQCNRRFRMRANQIIQDINGQKAEIYRVLRTEIPDSMQLQTAAHKIGALHAALKEETIHFYLALNAVCTNEQRQKLQSVFSGLFREAPIVGCRRNNK